MEQSKTSIFQCRTCKADVTVNKRMKREGNDNAASKPLVVQLKPAKDSHQDTKYIIKVGGKQVAFGSKGMSDLTQHKDDLRK